jgi:hypothetical protein
MDGWIDRSIDRLIDESNCCESGFTSCILSSFVVTTVYGNSTDLFNDVIVDIGNS